MTPDEIKAIRKLTGLNSDKFGALVGVGKKTVESWEHGARNPSGPAVKIMKQIEASHGEKKGEPQRI